MTTVVTAVTMTTITTVTAVTTVVAMGLAAAVAAVVTVGFGVLLGTRELAGGTRSEQGLRLARFLGVAVWPLAITFGVFMTMKVVEVL